MRAVMALLLGGASGLAQAHVSSAQGLAHAGEHLWLLLALPAVFGVRWLGGRILAQRRVVRRRW